MYRQKQILNLPVNMKRSIHFNKKTMKKFYVGLIAVLAIQFMGCSNNNAKAQEEKRNKQPDEEVLAMNNVPEKGKGTIMMDKALFLEKIWNYEKNPQEFVYQGDKPSLIDFYADWCGPCRMMAPVMEELAKEYEGQIYIYKIDTEVEKELSAAMGIRSLPTFLAFPMKDQPQLITGAKNKEMFKELIDNYMLNKK
jgi:thioredoxin